MSTPLFTRRAVLGAATAGVTAATIPGLGDSARAGAPAILKPLPADRFVDFGTNAEMRWSSVTRSAYLTAQRNLFVRNHTSTPTIDPGTYALRVHGDGLVRGERSLSLRDLRRLGTTQLTAVHECTGNGRSFFSSQQGQAVSGTAWTLGAVGTVRWEGVPLARVLDAVGVRTEAVSIMATGLDDEFVSGGLNYGRVRRPFPVSKAYDDALLAWGANGEPLLPDHGYPLRLVLPGWVGIASIKWLGSLEVSTTGLTSPWNTKWYNVGGQLTVNPVRSAWELAWNAQVPSARRIRLHGRAWSGAGAIARVDVSLDGGGSWQQARIDRPGRTAGWTQWSVDWDAPARGTHTLLARATDTVGRTQPDVAVHNENGYFFDAVVRHPVTVV